MEKADPQERQLAEQWLASRGLADLSLYWPTNKPMPQIDYESGRAKPDLIDLLAAFASHTRREALEPYRDALRQCAHALKLLHPRMDETESCIVKEAYDTARLLAEEKK